MGRIQDLIADDLDRLRADFGDSITYTPDGGEA